MSQPTTNLPRTMRAVTINAALSGNTPFSTSNQATSSALHVRQLPLPSSTTIPPNTVLVRIHAASIIRDMLAWPETYATPDTVPGNDFAGVVVATSTSTSTSTSAGKELPRLTEESEPPEIHTNEDNPAADEIQENAGPGARERTEIRYDAGLTTEGWLAAVDDDDGTLKDIIYRHKARTEERQASKEERRARATAAGEEQTSPDVVSRQKSPEEPQPQPTKPDPKSKSEPSPDPPTAGDPPSSASGTAAPTPPLLRVGDEVYGMTAAERPCTWAEYALIPASEAARKPRDMGFEKAAAVPLSALTAWQALFRKGGLQAPGERPTGDGDGGSGGEGKGKVLVTGATGGVGVYLVQFARLAGYEVFALSRARAKDESALKGLGAERVLEFGELGEEELKGQFAAVIDTVGGEVLERCLGTVKSGGSLITVSTEGMDFVEEYEKRGIARKDVKSLFFIVEPSSADLEDITRLIEGGEVKIGEPIVYKLEEVIEAYDVAHGKEVGGEKKKGKVVLSIKS